MGVLSQRIQEEPAHEDSSPNSSPTTAVPKQHPWDFRKPGQPPGWKVRGLYDFEGQTEYNELSFRAGDVMTVIKVGIAEGWSLAEKDGAQGLVPESYVTYIHDFSVSPEIQGHSHSGSTATAYSTLTSTTNPRNSVFGKRQLNRFSWFVTTGVEEFLLTGGSSSTSHATSGGLYGTRPVPANPSTFNAPDTPESLRSKTSISRDDDDEDADEVTESDKHYIQSGPSWQEKVPLFHVRVHDPETRRKMVGMQEYTVFQVTSTFPQGVSVTVERRYSQFEWLYARLLNKFGALILPVLPEKQYAGRFSEEFIEKRRRALERFINRLVRHPIIRYSDIMTHFLGCSDDNEWKRAEKRFDADKIVGTSFFQHVYHPEFNVGEDGDVDEVERFGAHCRGTERLMPVLVDSATAFKDGVQDNMTRYKRYGLALLRLISTSKDGPENRTLNDDLAWCWREGCKDCLKLTKALQTTAETMQLIAELHPAHMTDGCLPYLEMLKEQATPAATNVPLMDMHSGTHRKLVEVCEKEPTMEEVDSETVKSRCDTVFNITLAEIDRTHNERVQDFEQATASFLDAQIAYHEQILAHLKQARAAFATPYYDTLANTPRFRSKYEREMDDAQYQVQRPSRPVSVASVASVSNVVGGVVDGVGFMGGLLKSKTRTSVGRSAMFGDWSAWGSGKKE
ncbi:hypothetical protein BGW41_001387 [Actinomortierella wolfii]|nr:hypothetical protein BGW41_001387 [Actinomortierella wolfii]